MTAPQISAERYVKGDYNSLTRFISYAYQLEAMYAAKGQSILIIGVGDGVVPDLLKKNKTLRVVTSDIDPELLPDTVADIRNLPFEDASYDVVCAFEVLEHLPWEESRKGLAEMARVSKGSVIVSVPHRRTGFELAIKFPFMRTLLGRDFIRLALLFPVRFHGFAVSKQHYWEIDGRSTTLQKFRSLLEENFHITREDTAVLDPYRRFFRLQKKK